MHGTTPLLVFCGLLAVGEYLASFVPLASGCWPAVVCLAVFAVLFGYGLNVRGWPYVFAALLGSALYFWASEGEIEANREKPWKRCRVTDSWRSQTEQGTLSAIRCDFSRRIAVGLGERDESVALGRAILLGDRDDLSPRTKRLFVESGTMHVFAISGLHVMAVADVIAVCLSLLLVPRRMGGLLSVPLLWGYVAVIGFPPSAVRAALMATFSLMAPVFWRKPDGLRSWGLAFLVVHLANPLLVVHVGNALSFSVMLAIALAGRMGEGLSRWKKTLLATVAAWAVGLPICAHVFGRVTPGSMIANLVLIETAKVSVFTGVLGVLASYVSDVLAAHVNNLSALCVRAMVVVAEAVSHVPGASLVTVKWGYGLCIEWYALLALVGCILVKRRGRLVGQPWI